jgi:hypothetical protein
VLVFCAGIESVFGCENNGVFKFIFWGKGFLLVFEADCA